MRRPNSSTLVLVALVVVLVLSTGGAAVVAIVNAVRGRRAIYDAVHDEAAQQFTELRPDLSPAQVEAAAALLAAQAVHESGAGGTAWREGYNFGNVTAGSGKPNAVWNGDVVIGPDTEYDAAGNVRNIDQHFRKYRTLDDAVSDYILTVLNWRAERLAHARDLLFAGDADGYVAALSQARYFTQPLPEYQAGVRAALEAYSA